MLRVFRRRTVSVVAVVVLCFGGVVTPSAMAQGLSSDNRVIYDINLEQEPVGAARSGLDGSEPGFNDNVIDNAAGAQWNPTDSPQSEVVDGQMRSDREEIPAGFSKQQADQAELQEAQEQAAARSRSGGSHCSTYWPSPFRVCGAIRAQYEQMGGPRSFLTWPRADETVNPDGVGYRSEFVNGFIYWHPDTGAHPVTTHFSVLWSQTGWEAGPLGYPVAGEVVAEDGAGRKQHFVGGRIYGSLSGAGSVRGRILQKWLDAGGVNSSLGYPIGHETGVGDGRGQFNNFAGGAIYWTPTTDARVMQSVPLDIWRLRGGPGSQWGYPVGDVEFDREVPVGIAQNFESGRLDVFEEFRAAGVRSIGGKEYSGLLIDIFESLGISLSDSVRSRSVDDSAEVDLHDDGMVFEDRAASAVRSSRACPIDRYTGEDFGGVSIPQHYEYWGCHRRSVYTQWNGWARHDYCTKSFDKVLNANFRGACARHDLCMDQRDSRGQGYAPCNAKLWLDMRRICEDVYSSFDPRRSTCISARESYFAVVNLAQRDNL